MNNTIDSMYALLAALYAVKPSPNECLFYVYILKVCGLKHCTYLIVHVIVYMDCVAKSHLVSA